MPIRSEDAQIRQGILARLFALKPCVRPFADVRSVGGSGRGRSTTTVFFISLTNIIDEMTEPGAEKIADVKPDNRLIVRCRDEVVEGLRAGGERGLGDAARERHGPPANPWRAARPHPGSMTSTR